MRQRPDPLRSGYTLFEMILVLAVIAAFVSMTIPSVMRIMRQEKLMAAAEKVRSAVAAARVRAIQSGLIYQFCCEANGSHFVVAPFEPDHLGSIGAGAQNSTNANTTGNHNQFGRVAGHLSDGITLTSALALQPSSQSTQSPPASQTIQAAQAPATNAYKLAPNSLDGLPNAADLANLNWSLPILFNADGSANLDFDIVVADKKAQRIRIHIRGFTGAASVSRIYTEKR